VSWRHSKAIGELDLKDPTAKLVGLALAHHANEYSGQCWPGIKRLARFTGLSERSIYNGLRILEERRVITTKRRKNETSLYTISLETALPIDQFDGGAAVAGGGVHDVQVGGAPAAPKQSDEQTRDARASQLAEDWKPSADTVAWIERQCGIDTATIDAELEIFVLRNLANEVEVKNPDQAFRLWCKRRDGLAHPPPAPRRRKATATQPVTREKLEERAARFDKKADDIGPNDPMYQQFRGWAEDARRQLRAMPLPLLDERTTTS
jgi:hypothetical protein